jgi:hypothetical protein
MAKFTLDDHRDDPDPRGPDFDLDVPRVIDPRRFETFSAMRVIPRECQVCGLVHEPEPNV